VRSAGRNGLARAITNNNALAQLLAQRVESAPELELISASPLSIVRFRYAPASLRDQPLQLDLLNKALTQAMQRRGRAFLTSTHLQQKEVLRACIVNYMTTEADIHTIVDETIRVGNEIVSRYC
jgi:glutamate/tyrosine decarboxylase-like PLP-dependent enzyme